MNKILISGIKVDAVIGVYKFEKNITQTLCIDLSFSVDIERAAKNDALTDTHDYKKITKSLIAFVQNTPCQLLETLAKKLLDYLQQEFQLSWLQIAITKHPLDLPQVQEVVLVATTPSSP